MEDSRISLKKLKEDQSQNPRNLVNCKRNHSQTHFINVETRSLAHSDLFEKTEKENYPSHKLERQSSITRVPKSNAIQREGTPHFRQMEQKNASKEVERYINTIDSLNHLISNNFKLEQQLQKKGIQPKTPEIQKYSIVEEQQKRIKQLEQLVQRLQKNNQELVKENKAIKYDQARLQKHKPAINVRNLQLQQENAQLLSQNQRLSTKVSRLQVDLELNSLEYENNISLWQGQKQKLLQMLQSLQLQEPQKKQCSCKEKEKYPNLDKREVRILKDQLKMTNGQLAKCRKEMEASKESYRKEAQTVKTAGKIVEQLQELYKAISIKAERQAKENKRNIQSLQKGKKQLQQHVKSQQKLLSELRAKVDKTNEVNQR